MNRYNTPMTISPLYRVFLFFFFVLFCFFLIVTVPTVYLPALTFYIWFRMSLVNLILTPPTIVMFRWVSRSSNPKIPNPKRHSESCGQRTKSNLRVSRFSWHSWRHLAFFSTVILMKTLRSQDSKITLLTCQIILGQTWDWQNHHLQSLDF